MNISSNQPPAPDETPEETPEQTPEGTTPAPGPINAEPAKAERTGYAVFDETYAKYVGGVHATKKEAEAIAKKYRASGSKTTVREV